MEFKLFNKNRKEKGVEKNEDTTPNVGYYFKSLWRKFTKLLSVNLLAILQFVPLFVAFFAYFWAETTPTVTDLSFPLINGLSQMEPSAVHSVLWMLSSPQLNIPVLSSGVLLTIGGMCLLFALLFGWWNVGFTYLMRELVNGRPIFIFSDLKHAIKRNAKQGFLLGLLDFIILFILGVNIFSMGSGSSAGFLGDFFYVANIAIAIIYTIMRFYIYLMVVTFDMGIFKILKNALIFVMLGIKRNLLAILWIAILLALNVLLFVVFTPLGIILPILYIASIPLFTTVYAAYPVIHRYMVEPALSENKIDEEADTLFADEIELTAAELWAQFVATGAVEESETYKAWSFGNDTDALARLVLQGKKTATSSAHPLYSVTQDELPRVGEYNVILDSRGNAVCVTQTVKVYVLPFQKVTEEHAALEGEGDGSLKHWRKVHKTFFSQEMEREGLTFSEETKIVCEQFKVVYQPE